MSPQQKFDLRQWSQQLEAGEQTNETLRLAAALQETHPVTPPAPAAFKHDLRHRLLAQHTAPHPFRGAIANLWRFAGSVAAFALLATAVTFFWLSLSPREAAVGPIIIARNTPMPASATPLPTPLPTPLLPPLPSGLVMERVGDPRFGADDTVVTLYGFADAPPQPIVGDPLTVHLIWLQEGPSQAWNSFVHLLDDNGQLAAQVDAPLWVNGRFQQSQSFTLPTIGLNPGVYQIVSGIYDAVSGHRLPANDDNRATVLLGTVSLAPAEQPVTESWSDDSNTLHVTGLSLPAGGVLTTTTPITITLRYQFDDPAALYVTAKIVERLPNSAMRVIADSTTLINHGIGFVTLTIPFTAADLNGPANLGLLIEARSNSADPTTPPDIFFPTTIVWRYQP